MGNKAFVLLVWLLFVENISECSSLIVVPTRNEPLSKRLTQTSNGELSSRRQAVETISSLAFGSWLIGGRNVASANAVEEGEEEAGLPQVTSKVFVDVKSPTMTESQRIVIGLYGKDAPSSTQMLTQLMSNKQGLPAKCKPKEERLLQKEQLEVNKVYNSCIENESKGVNYEYATIWRILRDNRIDFGAVQGKFISRQFPTWADENSLPILPGTVSVQKGNEGGFGFAIHPVALPPSDSTIVIGRVLEGMDVIAKLNESPVVQSSKLNYMAITGSSGEKSAPTRACRYGSSALYCNEFKPLQKLNMDATGVL